MDVLFIDKRISRFIAGLDKPTIAKVLHVIELLEHFGHALRMPHSKQIGHSLYELRVRGRVDIRLIYTFRSGDAIVLHTFIKKSERLHQKDLRAAYKAMRELDNT